MHAGCWPHATDTKHAQRIKTEMRMRFMTNLQKINLYDGNPFPGNSGHSPQRVLRPIVRMALRGGETR